MFDQDPRVEEVSIDDLEVGDHCLFFNEGVGMFWREEDFDWRLCHCTKLSPDDHYLLIDADQYLGQNKVGGGSIWGFSDEAAKETPVVKIEQFSVPKETFIDKVQEVVGDFAKHVFEQALEDL